MFDAAAKGRQPLQTVRRVRRAPRYRRVAVRPRLAKGAARAGRDAASVALMVSPLVATGATQADADRAREERRSLLAFLYSTPAYARSLELFGWSECGERLHALSREGRWQEMPALVSDAMLDALVPTAPYAGIADLLRDGFGDLADRIAFPMPDDPAHDSEAAAAVNRLRA